MRRALPFLVLLVLLAPTAGAHPIGSPADVNYLLDHFRTPDLAPGERGRLSLEFANPYPSLMTNIFLELQVYRYREIDVDLLVDGSWPGPGPDFVDDSGTNWYRTIQPLVAPSLNSSASTNVSFSVLTYPETRHGSITSQGSYFVRTRLEFDFASDPGNHSVMMSKGHFTDAQFEEARRPCLTAAEILLNLTCPTTIYYEGEVNLTSLGSVYGLDHLDGLLPDTGFSVQERLPLWPFVGVGALMVASLGFAVLFYAEENPGKMPRLARWWLGVRGRARRPSRPKQD